MDRSEAEKQVEQEFAPKRAEYKEWVKTEEKRLEQEYATRMPEAMKAPGGEQKLKDDMKVRWDELTAERGNRESALIEEEQARKRELLGE